MNSKFNSPNKVQRWKHSTIYYTNIGISVVFWDLTSMSKEPKTILNAIRSNLQATVQWKKTIIKIKKYLQNMEKKILSYIKKCSISMIHKIHSIYQQQKWKLWFKRWSKCSINHQRRHADSQQAHQNCSYNVLLSK